VGNAQTLEEFLIAHSEALFPQERNTPTKPLLGTWGEPQHARCDSLPTVGTYEYTTDLPNDKTSVHLIDQTHFAFASRTVSQSI
jgi:hypothetical protein